MYAMVGKKMLCCIWLHIQQKNLIKTYLPQTSLCVSFPLWLLFMLWHFLRCYPTPFLLLLVDLLPVQLVSLNFAGSSRSMDLSEGLSKHRGFLCGAQDLKCKQHCSCSLGQGNWGWGVKYPVIILLQGKASLHGRAVSRRCPGLCSRLQWGTSCETRRWDGTAFISGHVWWLEVQDRPSLDMANTTCGSVWVLSTAWMHKGSLSFLKSI